MTLPESGEGLEAHIVAAVAWPRRRYQRKKGLEGASSPFFLIAWRYGFVGGLAPLPQLCTSGFTFAGLRLKLRIQNTLLGWRVRQE